MIIKKDTREEKKVSPGGRVFEYELESSRVKIATAKLNSRMPEEGSIINEKCEEVFYVVKGSAKFYLDNKEFDVSEGDIVEIKPNQRFHYIADNLEVVISTSPPWYAEQWKIIK